MNSQTPGDTFVLNEFSCSSMRSRFMSLAKHWIGSVFLSWRWVDLSRGPNFAEIVGFSRARGWNCSCVVGFSDFREKIRARRLKFQPFGLKRLDDRSVRENFGRIFRARVRNLTAKRAES